MGFVPFLTDCSEMTIMTWGSERDSKWMEILHLMAAASSSGALNLEDSYLLALPFSFFHPRLGGRLDSSKLCNRASAKYLSSLLADYNGTLTDRDYRS